MKKKHLKFRIHKLFLQLLVRITSNKRIIDYFYIAYHKRILNYLEKEYAVFINSFVATAEPSSSSPSDNVWIFWWQGVESAPILVRRCIESIRKFSQRNIVIVDHNNYQQYTDIAPHVIKKFENGLINKTKLSNIIRMSLLKNHGGVWMDSTIFLSREMPKELSNKHFFTLKSSELNNINVAKKKWTTFFIGGVKGYPMFEFVQKFHEKYWESEDNVVDYLLLDYIIAIAYKNNIGGFKEDVDKLEYNNEGDYDFINNINKSVSEDLLKSIFGRETYVFKLSYKKK